MLIFVQLVYLRHVCHKLPWHLRAVFCTSYVGADASSSPVQDSVQDAASFNHNSSSRAKAQKCLLHTQDEDPTSVIPAKAVIELSEEVEQAGEDQAHPAAHDSTELPTSTPASADHPDLDLPQGSSTSEIEPQIDDVEAAQAGSSPDSEDAPIPVSSTAAVVPPPVPDAQATPAHPESTTQLQQAQHELLDSAMDIQPGTRDSQADKASTANDGTVSDAAMLAASHAVVIEGVQEKGVRTAAAAAAAALAPEVDDIMWPALMRQEAEGGVLLIEALKRSLQSGDTPHSIPHQGSNMGKTRVGFPQLLPVVYCSKATWQHSDKNTVHHSWGKLVPRMDKMQSFEHTASGLDYGRSGPAGGNRVFQQSSLHHCCCSPTHMCSLLRVAILLRVLPSACFTSPISVQQQLVQTARGDLPTQCTAEDAHSLLHTSATHFCSVLLQPGAIVV